MNKLKSILISDSTKADAAILSPVTFTFSKKKAMKTLLPAIVLLSFVSWGQELPQKGTQGGVVSVGMRSTLSAFNDGENEPYSVGLGGQFRIQASNRVNTEWFFDYLPSSNGYERRNDFHIGWSVMYYVLENPIPKVRPYVIAGHCFDYTYRQELANPTNAIDRWSSAVQAGAGAHFRLTDRLDLSLSSQYMMHLGTHVHSHSEGGHLHFEKELGGSLEGHLLTTVSLNYKIADLWGGK